MISEPATPVADGQRICTPCGAPRSGQRKRRGATSVTGATSALIDTRSQRPTHTLVNRSARLRAALWLLLCAFYIRLSHVTSVTCDHRATSHRTIAWLRAAMDAACSYSRPACSANTRSRVRVGRREILRPQPWVRLGNRVPGARFRSLWNRSSVAMEPFLGGVALSGTRLWRSLWPSCRPRCSVRGNLRRIVIGECRHD